MKTSIDLSIEWDGRAFETMQLTSDWRAFTAEDEAILAASFSSLIPSNLSHLLESSAVTAMALFGCFY